MKLNLMAPINQLSYGLVSLNFLTQLNELGWEIALFPIGSNIEAEPQHHELIRKCLANTKKFDDVAPTLRIYHQFSMAESIGSGPRWGMYFNEMDRLTPLEVRHLNSLDNVITCSNFARQAAINSGVTRNVDVVHLGYDSSIFKVNRNTIPTGKTIFLNVGKFEYRKGHDVLPDIFSSSFTPKDNVELWMMNTNPFLSDDESKEWINMYTNSPMGSKIKIIPRQESQHQVAYLMQNATCGIFPSRAEGWGLPTLEMMGCGRPSIVTNYSGHTEFCTADTSILIEPDGLEDASDGKWFSPTAEINAGKWMKLTDKVCSQIGEAMRRIHEHPEEIKTMENNCVNHVKEFTWTKVSQQLHNLLKDVV